MKSILTHSGPIDGFTPRLQTALDIARRFDGHISIVQPRLAQEYVAFDMVGGAHFIGQAYAAAEEARDGQQAKIEAMLAHEDVPWDIETVDGSSISGVIADSAYLSDLVVLSLDDGHTGIVGLSGSIVGDVVMATRVPVLAIPNGNSPLQFNSAAIAFDGSAEAATAVRMALPLLAQCDAVHIIEIGVEADMFPLTDVAKYLSRHGIAASIEAMPKGSNTIEERLLAATRSLSPDFLVMGAYGKSRWREALFGGVTRYVLAEVGTPVLMAH